MEKYGFEVRTGQSQVYAMTMKKHAIVAEYDSQGILVSSLHSPTGMVGDITEVHELVTSGNKRNLYLGSNINSHLVKVVTNGIKK
jgi:hypothetical protein